MKITKEILDEAMVALNLSENEYVCESCIGIGTVDETLGGFSFNDPKAKCPDCAGDAGNTSPC